jgi:hypothetical protein
MLLDFHWILLMCCESVSRLLMNMYIVTDDPGSNPDQE